MKYSLKAAVSQKVQSTKLSPEQLINLQAIGEKSTNQPQSRFQNSWFRSYKVTGSIAASILLALIIYLTPELSSNFLKQEDLIKEIASEVVKNHLHMKPLDVKSNNLDEVRTYFTQLDFWPRRTMKTQQSGLQLLGGRYCSLQGVTAAQLRFKNINDGELSTLYQVGYDPAVFKKLPVLEKNETPITTFIKGIKVTLWVEKGLLFALTEPEKEAEDSNK